MHKKTCCKLLINNFFLSNSLELMLIQGFNFNYLYLVGFSDFLRSGHKKQENKKKGGHIHNPTIINVTRSKILDKAEIFLDKMAKANEKLAIDVQVKPREEIEVDALTGNDRAIIQIVSLLTCANKDEGLH